MMLLVVISSFLIVLFGMPTLIKVAKMKHLVDEPEDPRKIHHRSIPTVGGIMIFIALFFNVYFWMSLGETPPTETFQSGSILAACCVLIFFMGLKDDIIGMSAAKKLLVHLVVGFLLVTIGGFRIHSFGGLFGVEALPEALSMVFSLFVYVVVVNAMNLIDGIDGLVGGYSVIAMSAFGLWLMSTGQPTNALVAFTMAGSMAGFLVFNFAPARIFLGDCGSLLLGLVAYTMATQVINTPQGAIPESWGQLSKPILAMSILAYPLIDTLRVFFLRAARGISPFNPDRNHLHHRLMVRHRSHARTAVSVYTFTVVIIGIAWVKPYLYPTLGEEGMFFGLFILSFIWFLPILRTTRGQHKLTEQRDRLLKEAQNDQKKAEAQSAVA